MFIWEFLIYYFYLGGGGTSTVNDVKIERDTLLNCVFDVCSLKSQPITKILCILFQNTYLYRHSEWSIQMLFVEQMVLLFYCEISSVILDR